MSHRGALLKPSEKKTGRSVAAKTSRYEVLKEKIRTWWENRFEVGKALLEIRDERHYAEEYATFEEFCQAEYGFERAHAYRLISFAEVKESIQMSPIGDKIQRESQARALSPVPVEQREEVVEKAAERGPVTAKAITEVAKEIKVATESAAKPEAEPTPERQLDKTGYPIPDAILSDWKEAESFRSTLADLQQIKLQVEKAVEKGELIYREIGQDTVADLTNARRALTQVLPYAVCPTCQGRTRSKCAVCKQRGFVSEFGYKHWFAKEVIELREKAIKK